MCIPRQRQASRDAHELMDYVYQPGDRRQISEYVNYITPGPGGEGERSCRRQGRRGGGRRRDADYLNTVAGSAVVPDGRHAARGCTRDKHLDEAEEKQWNDLFEAAGPG